MEQGEINGKRDYHQLDSYEKVKSILAAVFEPVSKPYAIKLSGVSFEKLDDVEKQKIYDLFDNEAVELTKSDAGELFRLDESARELWAEEVNMKSVHSWILDVAINQARRADP